MLFFLRGHVQGIGLPPPGSPSTRSKREMFGGTSYGSFESVYEGRKHTESTIPFAYRDVPWEPGDTFQVLRTEKRTHYIYCLEKICLEKSTAHGGDLTLAANLPSRAMSPWLSRTLRPCAGSSLHLPANRSASSLECPGAWCRSPIRRQHPARRWLISEMASRCR